MEGRFQDIEKMLTETIERESEVVESQFLGDLFLDEEDPQEQPKRRGRPPGIKESAPRKRKHDSSDPIAVIKEHVESALRNLELL